MRQVRGGGRHGGWDILEEALQEAKPEMTPEEMSQRIAALYAHCYRDAQSELTPLGASEETVKCAASSALIWIQKSLGDEALGATVPTSQQEPVNTSKIAQNYSVQVVEPPTPKVSKPHSPHSVESLAVEPNRDRPDPGPVANVSESQLKRLYTIASKFGWQHAAVKLLLKEGYGLDSSKELSPVQYEQVCSQMQAIPPDEFNAKASAQDPAKNLKRFRAIAKSLGLKKKDGDALIQQAISERYPGKKSADLLEPEVNSVRDSIFIAYGANQLPTQYRTIVAGEYLQMAGALQDEDDPVDDEAISMTWLEVLAGLISNVNQRNQLNKKSDG